MYQINHVSAAALTTVTSYYNFTSFYINIVEEQGNQYIYMFLIAINVNICH
jgi:hypothetical protein